MSYPPRGQPAYNPYYQQAPQPLQAGYPPNYGRPAQAQQQYPQGFQTQVGYGQPPPQPARPQGPQGWYGHYWAMIQPQEMQVMQQWFQSVDRDRSGSISSQELAQIQFSGKPLGVSVATKLIKVFDRDHSGSIDFNEYAVLHKFLTMMQNAFFTADRDRSGTIDPPEILQGLQQAGFSLSMATVQAYGKKFDPNGKGLDFPNFLWMCSHLAHCRSIFEWNDTQRRNQIVLSYDALCHIAVDLLP